MKTLFLTKKQKAKVKRQKSYTSLIFTLCFLPFDFLFAADMAALPMSQPAPTSRRSSMGSSSDSVLEEGRILFENGQYLAALGKFMTVLRREPRQPEARQYLRMVIEVMKKNPATMSAKPTPGGLSGVSSAQMSEEIRQRIRQRALLTMDLKAIPGVRVQEKNNLIQVEMDTPMLFTSKTGGLKEESIPVLDRVAAWLKTFGQQPITIHCYPEEGQDPESNGSLYLHRYAELFSFLVEERKIPASRLVTADALVPAHPVSNVETSSPSAPVADTGRPHVVIEMAVMHSSRLEALIQGSPSRGVARWLEFSILASKTMFNPEEGEWASMDLAALTRTGLRSWVFKIVPLEKGSPVYQIEGKGNLLKRVSWDGRNLHSGSFAPAGTYICRLVATDSDGYTMTREVTLQLQRNTEAVVTKKHKKKTPHVAKKKASTGATQSVKAEVPAESPETAEPAAVAEPSAPGSSVRAIWKQVIQFESGESDLKPSLESSLERIGKTLEVYPLQKVRILGFAEAGEKNASSLAKKRAEQVRDILVNKYQVPAERVIVAGGQVAQESGSHKVEISITN